MARKVVNKYGTGSDSDRLQAAIHKEAIDTFLTTGVRIEPRAPGSDKRGLASGGAGKLQTNHRAFQFRASLFEVLFSSSPCR